MEKKKKKLHKFQCLLSKFIFIELQRRIFKTDEHPSVAASLSCIAGEYSNLGDYRNALEQYEKVLGTSNIYIEIMIKLKD